MENIYILERKHLKDLVAAINNIENKKEGILIGGITQKIEFLDGMMENWNENYIKLNINTKYMATIRKTSIL